MASSAIAYSAPSEWTEPVQVLPDQFYFITGATDAGRLGEQLAPPRATAEVYRFFYGYFRKAAVSLEPGDTIAATIKLPDPAKLPIYDMTAPPPPPGSAPPPEAPMPAPRPAKQGPDGGGKGGGMRIIDERQSGGGGETRQAQQEKPKITLPANAKPYPKPSITASIDTVLLDVAKTVGGGDSGVRSQAILRGSDGQIIVLNPDDQRHLPIYQLAAASAKDGENQGQPATLEPGKDPTRLPPKVKEPGEKRPPSAPPPGGGGGGGGAGGG
jgi:hypothetical protein